MGSLNKRAECSIFSYHPKTVQIWLTLSWLTLTYLTRVKGVLLSEVLSEALFISNLRSCERNYSLPCECVHVIYDPIEGAVIFEPSASPLRLYACSCLVLNQLIDHL